jgi:hypothetical protein
MGEDEIVVIDAFNEEHVERLTGLSRGQLRAWDRGGFLLRSMRTKIVGQRTVEFILSEMS